jgi:acetoin utilization protein AcuB
MGQGGFLNGRELSMTVKDRMSSPAVTATPATRTKEALQTMYVRKIRRMPVVGEPGKLLGIVTQRDLYEKGKADTPVGAIMTRNPYTIAPDASIVRAATLMRNLGVGGLPVLDHGQLVGIITESDIFDAFLELLGARRAGTRIIVPLSNLAEGVARVLQSLAPTGAHLTGLTTITEDGRPAVIVTADERDPRDLVRALASGGLEPTLISVQDAAA